MNMFLENVDLVTEDYLLKQSWVIPPLKFRLTAPIRKGLIHVYNLLSKEVNVCGLNLKGNVQYKNFNDLQLFTITRDVYFLRRFFHEFKMKRSMNGIQSFYLPYFESLSYAISQKNQLVIREYTLFLCAQLHNLIKENNPEQMSLVEHLIVHVENLIAQLMQFTIKESIAESLSLMVCCDTLMTAYEYKDNKASYDYYLTGFQNLFNHAKTLAPNTDTLALMGIDDFFKLNVKNLDEFGIFYGQSHM